jgi:SAM-dependent methyltransferase
MTFFEFFNKTEPKTDKGTLHDYIEGYYSNVFTPIKSKNIKILEIGIQYGYSVALWKGWFENLEFTGVDITEHSRYHEDEKTKIINKDAYNLDFLLLLNSEKFDFIIEDGPHSLETQIFSIQNFYDLLKQEGKLIIEDIQNDNDLNSLIDKCIELNYDYKVFDLRPNKFRYDDIILEITKK